MDDDNWQPIGDIISSKPIFDYGLSEHEYQEWQQKKLIDEGKEMSEWRPIKECEDKVAVWVFVPNEPHTRQHPYLAMKSYGNLFKIIAGVRCGRFVTPSHFKIMGNPSEIEP